MLLAAGNFHIQKAAVSHCGTDDPQYYFICLLRTHTNNFRNNNMAGDQGRGSGRRGRGRSGRGRGTGRPTYDLVEANFVKRITKEDQEIELDAEGKPTGNLAIVTKVGFCCAYDDCGYEQFYVRGIATTKFIEHFVKRCKRIPEVIPISPICVSNCCLDG